MVGRLLLMVQVYKLSETGAEEVMWAASHGTTLGTALNTTKAAFFAVQVAPTFMLPHCPLRKQDTTPKAMQDHDARTLRCRHMWCLKDLWLLRDNCPATGDLPMGIWVTPPSGMSVQKSICQDTLRV